MEVFNAIDSIALWYGGLAVAVWLVLTAGPSVR